MKARFAFVLCLVAFLLGYAVATRIPAVSVIDPYTVERVGWMEVGSDLATD